MFDAEAETANDNKDWRYHAKVAQRCLDWAQREPMAARGLLRAAERHATLARQMMLKRVLLDAGALTEEDAGARASAYRGRSGTDARG